MSFRITGSTMGQSTPATVAEEAGRYHWRKHPDWYPGNPAYREEGSAANRMAAGSAGIVAAERRQGRLKAFADALAGLGHPDPVKAPNPAVIEAGKLIGVGEKTAKSYRTEIRQQRQREEAAASAAAAGDAEPGEIVAALHAKIAGFSKSHAALVAKFERRQAGGARDA